MAGGHPIHVEDLDLEAGFQPRGWGVTKMQAIYTIIICILTGIRYTFRNVYIYF